HGIDAGLVEQLAQQQSGRTGADDGNLRTHIVNCGARRHRRYGMIPRILGLFSPAGQAAVPGMKRRIPNYFLYGEAPRPHDERTLHVEPIEARSARHRWKIDPHRHRSLHQLVLVQRGRGVALAEGSVAHFTPPAVTVMPAGAVHGFEFEPDTLGMVITVADELLQEFTRREPALAALFKQPMTLQLAAGAATTDLLRAARMLMHEYERPASNRALAVEGALALLLAQLLRLSHAEQQPEDSPLGRHRQLVARFRAVLEAGFRANHSIPQYARDLKV